MGSGNSGRRGRDIVVCNRTNRRWLTLRPKSRGRKPHGRAGGKRLDRLVPLSQNKTHNGGRRALDLSLLRPRLCDNGRSSHLMVVLRLSRSHRRPGENGTSEGLSPLAFHDLKQSRTFINNKAYVQIEPTASFCHS